MSDAAAVVVVIACSEGNDSGQSPGEQVGAEATTPDECEFLGAGGENGFTCNAVTIRLSEPVDRASLGVVVETDLGDTLDTLDESAADSTERLALVAQEDPAEALLVQVFAPPPQYAPSAVSVTVSLDRDVVGQGSFENLNYRCLARSVDDWCWESDPVELTISR